MKNSGSFYQTTALGLCLGVVLSLSVVTDAYALTREDQKKLTACEASLQNQTDKKSSPSVNSGSGSSNTTVIPSVAAERPGVVKASPFSPNLHPHHADDREKIWQGVAWFMGKKNPQKELDTWALDMRKQYMGFSGDQAEVKKETLQQKVCVGSMYTAGGSPDWEENCDKAIAEERKRIFEADPGYQDAIKLDKLITLLQAGINGQ